MPRRVLIANRGEIAVRIIRTCRALGIDTVAVYSDADRHARHVGEADRAVPIGPAPAADSYLSASRLIDAARETDADAIHPGYGFLSENAPFAAACADAGITFVGPSADVIATLGSKIEARRLATAAGVPVVPGGEPADQSTDGVWAAVRRAGYPALIKPSAGGGGKGMVVVRGNAETAEAIDRARREAVAAFGDGTLYVERLLERPRHVEVQIVGDHRGTVIHLGERDCSIQRRHQKVIEESPSPAVSRGVAERLAAAAVEVARRAGYDSVGTVEFLVDGTGDEARFFFLEMNTRLQVEHPVTELVTGVDLVEGQLVIADGQALPWTEAEVGRRGHAIECRIYAEDPANGFRPQAGRLVHYEEPTGPGIRVDAGVTTGSDVPVHYDPLIAKVIAAGNSRETARRRAVAALRRYVVLGVRTNIGFLERILAHPRFVAADVHNEFLQDEQDALSEPALDDAVIAAVAAAAVTAAGRGASAPSPDGSSASSDAWQRLRDWRLSPPKHDDTPI